jgi:hypothetical protein
MESPPWKVLEVEGRFTVEIPGDSRYRLSDGDDLLTVELATDPPTTVHITQYAFDAKELRDLGSSVCLQSAVEVYANNHLPRSSPRTSADFQYRTVLRHELWVCEALLASDRRSWRVHALAPRDSQTYYILSWNGPRKFLHGPVLEIFESFDPA